MVRKHSAQPPPPPPPAASSDETDSGSGSGEESEEEIAHSPPPAATKSAAPPPQKAPADDEEEDESDEDESDEDESEEEEDEDDAAVVAPIATKYPPLPPPPRVEPETADQEEEEEEEEDDDDETDDEAPEPEPAAAKGAESSAAGDKKPPAPFQRTWSTDDEVRILGALAAHRREHGALPQLDALVTALSGSLDHSGCGRADLQGKVNAMRRRYNIVARKGVPPSKEHDRRVFDLSRAVWGTARLANGGATRELDEVCQLYPYLAEEVKALEASHPGLFKRLFAMVDDDKARAMDAKIKKQRLVQMKVDLRRHDLTKTVTKVLMDLMD